MKPQLLSRREHVYGIKVVDGGSTEGIIILIIDVYMYIRYRISFKFVCPEPRSRGCGWFGPGFQPI
jgi:hypothetical protein